MEEPLPIVATLRESGHRITPFREQLIAIFDQALTPLSARDITALVGTKPRVHKTTLYRELEFLIAQELISPIEASDGIRRFERAGLPHHHHFRCVNCHRVDDLAIDEYGQKLEENLLARHNVVATNHTMELTGFCTNCSQIGGMA